MCPLTARSSYRRGNARGALGRQAALPLNGNRRSLCVSEGRRDRVWIPLDRGPFIGSFDGLRHTWATVALGSGVPAKVASEVLGHSSIAITLDTYSHVQPSMQEEATQAVADRL